MFIFTFLFLFHQIMFKAFMFYESVIITSCFLLFLTLNHFHLFMLFFLHWCSNFSSSTISHWTFVLFFWCCFNNFAWAISKNCFLLTFTINYFFFFLFFNRLELSGRWWNINNNSILISNKKLITIFESSFLQSICVPSIECPFITLIKAKF